MDAIRFGTDGWRAPLTEFTAPRVRAVGQAVATYLADEGQARRPLAVGYDARETSRGFAEELARVLCVNGHDVLLPDRDCPTPLVAWAVHDRDLAGAFMVTASHNPPEYNGVKFIPADAAPALPAVTDEIERNLARPDPLPEGEWGQVREAGFVDPHAEHARRLVAGDCSGLTVAYDAMHGSGRDVTDRLLVAAGATVERVRCRPDPTFGGTPPEPTPAHLDPLEETMAAVDADIGIANDGDADRVAVATPDRGVVDGSQCFALIYDFLLADASGPAVRTVSTSGLIDRIAAAHGEEVVETAVGFKWVAEAMAAHDALVGGEESGGYSMRGHIREKDGVLMALVLAAAAAAEPPDDRLDRLRETHGAFVADKVSLDCPDAEKDRVLAAVEESVPDAVAGRPVASVNPTDGVKLALEDGAWLLVRPSGTEPKMRIYAEADSDAAVREVLDAGRALVAPLV